MEDLATAFRKAKVVYDAGGCPFAELRSVSGRALQLLLSAAQGELPSVSSGGKQYSVFRVNGTISRPHLASLLLHDVGRFERAWDKLAEAADARAHLIALPPTEINSTLYTAVMSVCLCFDLWKPKSRKTPGTIFEVVLGSLLKAVLPAHARTKSIRLPDGEILSTDIVMMNDRIKAALVVAAKITTRERIVQPFAHQRILDSVFGAGKYSSLLACVSEMQRDEEETAREICVPGTLRLFQRHLAPISGIYYLDPPGRYLESDVTSVVRVGTLGDLFATDLRATKIALN